MVLVADLLSDNNLTANYFADDVYVHGTLELGLLENRRGDRLLALPESSCCQGDHGGEDRAAAEGAGPPEQELKQNLEKGSKCRRERRLSQNKKRLNCIKNKKKHFFCKKTYKKDKLI